MELLEQIESVLETKVRPLLRSHGGEVTLLGAEEGVVRVKLLGACSGCPSADLGTRALIEDTLREAIPQVRCVELDNGVSDELMEFARKLMYHQ